MNVLRTFVPHSMDNYNHLVVCPTSKTAAAVDPFNAEQLINLAQQQGLAIKHIWITHEHGDHIREVDKLKELTQATVYAPAPCKGLLNADVWLNHNQLVQLGEDSVRFWLTPGHIQGHGVYYGTPANKEYPAFVIAGDTLFNAGVGNVKAGNANQLFESTQFLNHALAANTELYTGHDYSITNLKFVLSHFPDNAQAKSSLAQAQKETPSTRSVKTMAQERTYNPFLATDQPWVAEHPKLANLSEQQRFVALRAWRDQW